MNLPTKTTGRHRSHSRHHFEAIIRCRPSTQQVQFMTMLAIEEYDDKDLLPKYKGLLDKKNLEDR